MGAADARASAPLTFVATREALHRVAAEIVAPARKPHNEIALTVTPGGFGTPPFEFEGRRLQVTVDGPDLVVIGDGTPRRTPLTTLPEAAAFVGEHLFPDGMPTDDEQLAIDADAARRLGAVYAVAAEALDSFRAELPAAAEPSTINLWPEHFDVAFEAGAEAAGERANYGVSPGDDEHPDPYAYVGPWSGKAEGELWNATGFAGAELGYGSFSAAKDPVEAIVEFFRTRFEALT